MANTLNNILIPVFVSVAISIIGILFNSWLIKTGVSRVSKKPEIIIITFFLVFSAHFLYASPPWWYLGIMFLLGVMFALNRTDIGTAMKHGKWWWLSQEKNEALNSKNGKRQ